MLIYELPFLITLTALGGDIRCDSELGQYTAFTLSFTVTTQQAPPVSPDKTLNTATNSLSTAPCSLAGKTILLAEDSRLNRLIVTAILESQGMRCVEAENGRAALDLWSTRHCDLVLTDLQMPFMDGLALARAIRESETSSASSSPVPIIALTSESGDSIEVARQSGVNAILAKPVSVDSLILSCSSVWQIDLLSASANILSTEHLRCLARIKDC